MKVGFTGTRIGMTPKQIESITLMLTACRDVTTTNYGIHGRCIGADANFNDIARSLNYSTIAYPASDVRPGFVSKCLCDEIKEARPALERNCIIVDQCDLVIATPKGYDEEFRGSGTWAAIRYAKKTGRRLYIYYPSGICAIWNVDIEITFPNKGDN